MIPIVIGNYNKPDLTRTCIDSIREHTKDVGHVVILVENGDKRCKKYNGGVNRIEFDKPIGFTRAYNAGIRYARKNLFDWKYICLMNNDVTVGSGWLEPLIKVMEDEPKVAIVAPLLDTKENEKDYDIPVHADLIGGHILAVERKKHKPGTLESYMSINFTCVLINRDFLDDCGIMDEGMETFCSDQDLSMRATMAGWRALICHDSIVNHGLNKTVNDTELIPGEERTKIMRKDQKFFLDKWSGLSLNEVMDLVPLHLKVAYHAQVSFFIRYPDGSVMNWRTQEFINQPRIDTDKVGEKFEKIKQGGAE